MGEVSATAVGIQGTRKTRATESQTSHGSDKPTTMAASAELQPSSANFRVAVSGDVFGGVGNQEVPAHAGVIKSLTSW